MTELAYIMSYNPFYFNYIYKKGVLHVWPYIDDYLGSNFMKNEVTGSILLYSWWSLLYQWILKGLKKVSLVRHWV